MGDYMEDIKVKKPRKRRKNNVYIEDINEKPTNLATDKSVQPMRSSIHESHSNRSNHVHPPETQTEERPAENLNANLFNFENVQDIEPVHKGILYLFILQ